MRPFFLAIDEAAGLVVRDGDSSLVLTQVLEVFEHEDNDGARSTTK
jgi:hypothetical protein